MKKKKLFTFHVQYTECLSKFVAHTVVIISHGKSMNLKKNKKNKNLQRYLPLVSHQQASNLPSSNGTFCNLHTSCISMREKVTIMIAPLKY
jgi:hypothetical protein